MIARKFHLIGNAAAASERQARLQQRLLELLKENAQPMTLADVMTAAKTPKRATEHALERLAARKALRITRGEQRRLRFFEVA